MTPELSARATAALDAEKAKAAKKYKITIDRLMAKLNEELEAKETKVFNDKESGIVYSDPLIAWKIRQEARRDAEAHLGIKPIEKLQLEHEIVPIRIVYVSPEAKKQSKVKIRKPGNGNG